MNEGKTEVITVDRDFFELLTESFARLVGRPLVAPECGPDWLYADAPFVVVAHNTAPDPRFVYANQMAQACFGYDWTEFITLPSRLSAEAPDRDERQHMLDEVTKYGFFTNYRGVRVKKSGAHFRIEDGIVWQLVDTLGRQHGQAATFSSWTEL